ncbi:MAG: SLC13 family permease [Verrucomicrobiales bacterium]|nr:SLC13 family permease [Verrucomicrobiales bacterium]
MNWFSDFPHLLPLLLIGLLFICLLGEWLEPEIAAWTAALVAVAAGLLPMDRALASLANPAPVTVAAMFILGAALEKTGVVNCIGQRLGRRGGGSEVAALTLLCVFACLASAFLNNTAVVAVLIPVGVGMAERARFSANRLLLPLSYAAILGGTCTLIGTSTNLAVQGVLADRGEPPLRFFEFTPLGIIYAAIGITYLTLFGRHLLPRGGNPQPQEATRVLPPLVQYLVLPESRLIGHTLVATLLPAYPGLQVLEVRRRGISLQESLNALGIRAGDRLTLAWTQPLADPLQTGSEEKAPTDLANAQGLLELETREQAVEEVVVPADSSLEGQRIRDLHFRQRFAVRILRLLREGEEIEGDLSACSLEAGDRLELAGPTEGLQRLLADTDVALVQPSAPPPPCFSRAGWVTMGWFLLFVLGSALHDVAPSVFRLPAAGMAVLCVLGLVFGRVMEPKDLYHRINWSIILFICGMLAVGNMLEHTGTAAWLAQQMSRSLEGAPPWLLLSAVYFGAMVLTELISNNAVAAMVTPVAITLAHQLQLDPRPFIIAVVFAASSSFSTPVGYQTNTLVYGAGGYRFGDFLRVGIPLNLTLWLVATVLIPVFWPLQK